MNRTFRLTALAAIAMAAALPMASSAGERGGAPKPTVVLVHGAFAGSEGWADVIAELKRDGYPVIAAANPLRRVASDAASVSALISSIGGPVVVVGHSYGGTVITNAATGHDNVRALVYVGAFSPDAGESVLQLSNKFPGSTLGQALAPPVPLADGTHDVYIAADKFRQQFCADVPPAQAQLMALTQRPIDDAALDEPSGVPAWRQIPSWHLYGLADRNIPAAAMHFMAERAGARQIVEIPNASHVPQVSHPRAVVRLIEEAAKAR